MSALTLETLANDSTRPHFINTFTRDTEDGEETGYGLKLTQMKDGDSITLRVSGDPTEWMETDGQYGTSLFCFFELEDDTTVTCYVRTGDNYMKTKGKGKSLAQRLQEFEDGDILRITLKVNKVKNTTRAWKCYIVEKVEDFQ